MDDDKQLAQKTLSIVKEIQVDWLCGMHLERCINRDNPGHHTGDYGYSEAEECCQSEQPAKYKKFRR